LKIINITVKLALMNFYFIVSSESDTPSPELQTKLKKYGKVFIIRHKGKLSEIKELVRDKEEKILGLDPKVFSWDLDSASFKNIQNVKAVCTSSTSFDWLKPKELKAMNIVACNVPGFSKDSVAEYILCMAIEITRRLPLLIKNGWKNDFKSLPILLKGKTVGIIGLGRIGTRVAELCQGIGMNVVYWSRKTRDKRFKYVELNKLFQTADVIIPALIENPETKTIITHQRLDFIRPNAVLVGINRVRVIWDENYVLDKVSKNEIGGYALEGEGLKAPAEYTGNVWPVPPIAGYTKDAFDNLKEIWVENMRSASIGKYLNKIN
jgi:phosphoglycerate dehydrogenase-like enzyme